MATPTKAELAAALERWAGGIRGPDEWERFAVTHYADPTVEEARVEVVRLLVFDGSGQEWPPSESTSRKLRELAKSLRQSAA
jgi:hypothetical protein